MFFRTKYDYKKVPCFIGQDWGQQRLRTHRERERERERERGREVKGLAEMLCVYKGQREKRRVNLEKWWNGQLLNIQDSTTKHLEIMRGKKKEEKVKDDRLLRLRFG